MYQKDIKFILFALFSIFFSCKKKDDVALKVVLNDENLVNKELVAKVFLTNHNWEIVHAYFDCGNQMLINFPEEKIQGCEKELFVKNDTIFIGFTPNETGMRSFDGIEVLIKDKDLNLRIVSFSFNYKVAE